MKCPLQWVVCGRNKFHNQYFRFYHDIKQIMPTIYGNKIARRMNSPHG
ncbi:hypothetical protein PXO_05422 [Xanthomonas oryzae pv. oryzae PXO99A]|uniref:Uncharacterized protein n=1 Tax=Xanthomonas oryzae pv. oryzae (strain PXO99A) TaxID=360094 RepID=A0A0K0GFP7_XANOP|nr:hypothetical protein PXO_05422 [Xanthomonas oryzae pv. oryzae PXO99A]